MTGNPQDEERLARRGEPTTGGLMSVATDGGRWLATSLNVTRTGSGLSVRRDGANDWDADLTKQLVVESPASFMRSRAYRRLRIRGWTAGQWQEAEVVAASMYPEGDDLVVVYSDSFANGMLVARIVVVDLAAAASNPQDEERLARRGRAQTIAVVDRETGNVLETTGGAIKANLSSFGVPRLAIDSETGSARWHYGELGFNLTSDGPLEVAFDGDAHVAARSIHLGRRAVRTQGRGGSRLVLTVSTDDGLADYAAGTVHIRPMPARANPQDEERLARRAGQPEPGRAMIVARGTTGDGRPWESASVARGPVSAWVGGDGRIHYGMPDEPACSPPGIVSLSLRPAAGQVVRVGSLHGGVPQAVHGEATVRVAGQDLVVRAPDGAVVVRATSVTMWQGSDVVPGGPPAAHRPVATPVTGRPPRLPKYVVRREWDQVAMVPRPATEEAIQEALARVWRDHPDAVVVDGDDGINAPAERSPTVLVRQFGIQPLAWFHRGSSGSTSSGVVLQAQDWGRLRDSYFAVYGREPHVLLRVYLRPSSNPQDEERLARRAAREAARHGVRVRVGVCDVDFGPYDFVDLKVHHGRALVYGMAQDGELELVARAALTGSRAGSFIPVLDDALVGQVVAGDVVISPVDPRCKVRAGDGPLSDAVVRIWPAAHGLSFGGGLRWSMVLEHGVFRGRGEAEGMRMEPDVTFFDVEPRA